MITPSRVIFDVRMNADGSVNKNKACLVAHGNHQDTSTFLILLQIRNFNYRYQNCFLYSPMKETIYLKRHPELSPNIMPSLVKLNKFLYGLRQTAHEWQLLVDSTVKSFGFTKLKTDACEYQLQSLIKMSPVP